MTSDIDLRLLVLVGRGADAVPVADLVDDLGSTAPPPPTAGAVISLSSAGREHLGATLTWGPFPRVAAQFEAAARRLERGETAVIRSAHMETRAGICLVAEPHHDAVVVSLGAVTDPAHARSFPDDPVEGEALLNHIVHHRDAVIAAAEHLDMVPLRGPRAQLITALRREATLAAELAERGPDARDC